MNTNGSGVPAVGVPCCAGLNCSTPRGTPRPSRPAPPVTGPTRRGSPAAEATAALSPGQRQRQATAPRAGPSCRAHHRGAPRARHLTYIIRNPANKPWWQGDTPSSQVGRLGVREDTCPGHGVRKRPGNGRPAPPPLYPSPRLTAGTAPQPPAPHRGGDAGPSPGAPLEGTRVPAVWRQLCDPGRGRAPV